MFHPIFIGATFLLLLHQLLQKVLLIPFSIIDAYLDDFLSMPFILSLFLIEQHLWKRRTSNLSIFEIIFFTVLIIVLFEEIIPKFNANYTKDYWDYLMYSLGSLVFYFSIGTKNLKQ